MNEKVTTFSTSDLYDVDLLLINVLLTQAHQSPSAEQEVVNACEYVLKKLKSKVEGDSKP